MRLINKVLGCALLASGLSFAHSGIVAGGSDGLHQINAKTLGQWNTVVGTGGTIATDAWAFTRGGGYEMNGQRHAFLDWAATMSGDFFIGIGLLDFLDLGVSMPLYYDHAPDSPGGASNMWTIGRGDLDIFAKIRAPFDTNRIWSVALLLDAYAPTGETQAGVRPRHAWYLNGEGYTQPLTADSWAFGAGLALTMDFSKRNFPLRWNGSAGVVVPTGDGEATTLVYSTGLNLVPIQFVDFFVEFSGEMRLQEKGDYYVDPFYDPMLVTPGMRFHITKNVDFAIGMDIAARTFKNLDFDYEEEMKGCKGKTIHFSGERGHEGSYCYAPTPLWAGAALLTIRFGGTEEKAPERPLRDTIVIKHEPQRDTIVIIMKDTTKKEEPKVGDFDNDGVPDNVDKCPNTKPGIEVGEDGCPPDHDKDGVPDYKDKCPNTEAGAEVDSNGCIPDFDRDGVPDNKDKCPNTLPGVVIDSVGCPVNKKEDLDELKKGIRFHTNSAKLTQRSFGTLNDVARLMKKFPTASLEVQGHTDNTGTDEYNMNLSQRRAQTVVDYLVKRGVEESRLRAVGYGNTMPIASNNSKEGRQINRRVEMVPTSNE